MKIVPYLFLLNSHYSQAIPIAQGGAIATPCVINTGDRKTYTVTEETDVEGAPQQLAFSCGPSGSTSMFMLFYPNSRSFPFSILFYSILLIYANVTLKLVPSERA